MRLTGFCTALGTLALVGCSARDAAKSDSAKVAQAGAAPAPTGTASRGTFDPTTHVAVVHTKDFAFEAPDTITAGWTNFHLVNDGPALHHVQLVRLDSGKTITDLSQALSKPGAPPRWAVMVGGPNAADPTGQADAAFNLPAGNYALICFVDIGDHVPHFAKGMTRPMTVAASSGAPMAEPSADATIDLTDYAFTAPKLSAGKHTIKVVNKGPQAHEVLLASLAPGKTARDLMTWIDKPVGPPPASARGGISGMDPGNSGYMTADLTPGNYALICFIPDMKDGKPHAAHGMVREFKVD